jgi:hypothetical protein
MAAIYSSKKAGRSALGQPAFFITISTFTRSFFMAIINDVNEVLHRIRVKLYPKGEGSLIARTDNEALLSIEDVCAALKNRGGFTGSYDDLVELVKKGLH